MVDPPIVAGAAAAVTDHCTASKLAWSGVTELRRTQTSKVEVSTTQFLVARLQSVTNPFQMEE
jgi:hypothetical protein